MPLKLQNASDSLNNLYRQVAYVKGTTNPAKYL